MHRSKILVVDDKPDNLNVVEAICRKHMPELEVITAGSGQEGIDLSRSEQPDTVLLDVIMPGLDGLKVCQILKSDPQTSNIPIILLVAINTECNDGFEGVELGADAFVHKPIKEAELMAQIKVMLRIKSAEDQLRQEKELAVDKLGERTTTLRQSEQKFKALFQQSGCQIILDPNGADGIPTIVDANNAVLNLHGYSRDEFIGRPITIVEVEPEKQSVIDITVQIMLGKPVSFETQHVKKDGTIFDVAVHAQRIDIGDNPPLIFTTEYDITEQKMTTAALEKNQHLLEKAQEIGQMGTWELDVQKDLLIWTDQNCRIFGVPAGTIPDYKLFISKIHPEDRQYVEDTWTKAKQGQPYEIEYRLLIDDKIKWIKEKAELTFGEDGNALHAIGFTQDITDQKWAEDQLQGSETRYRDLFSNMAEGFALCEMIFDKNGKPYDYRHLTVNDAYTKQTGISTKEVLGKTVREIFPDVEDVWIENYGEVALTGKAKSFVSYNHNTDRYFDARVFSPSRGFFALLVQDITQSHLDSLELRRSEAFNKSITLTAPYAIISMDDEGQVLTWNKAAEALFGFEETEMLGKTLKSIIPDQYLESHIAGLKRLREGGAQKLLGKTVEISALRKGQEEFPIELGLSGWINDDKRCYTAIIRDVSERQRIESELQAAVEVAEQANKVKDQFIANISHEIRTPLNSILGFTDLVKQKYGTKVEDPDRQIFGYISNSSNRLMATVDAILNISQLSAGSIVVQPKKNDLCTLSRLVVEDLRPMAVNKGLEVQTDIPRQALVSLIDDQSVYQALHNIIENALKFTREGEVNISLKQEAGMAVLTVKDTGIGISKAYQKRMYQPYTQESEGFTKDYQGIGLGLALAKRFLALNDVAIEVESEKGVGTRFKLFFKLYEEHRND